MAGTGKEVSGRIFRTKADYEAALRDESKIALLRSKIDFSDREAVLKLHKKIQDREYEFETVLGRDFDDEVYELVCQYKEGNAQEKKASPKAFGRKQPKKGAKHPSGRKSQKQDVKLEDYDEEMQKRILLQMYAQEKRRKRIQIAAAVLCVACLGYFGVYYYTADRSGSNFKTLSSLKDRMPAPGIVHATVTLDGDKEAPEILDQYKILYNKNKSLAGWIKIADTEIDYPVMQTVNNEYYLSHNYEQEYDKNGSIFLDKDCDIIDRSTNLIVYGHHMKSGKMFGTLDQYKNEGYYKEHKKIQFDTIYEEGVYEVMYAFRAQIYMDNEVKFKYYQFINAGSAEEFDSNMQAMREMSLYDTGVAAVYGDELLTLSTCDDKTDVRFVVVAKRVE